MDRFFKRDARLMRWLSSLVFIIKKWLCYAGGANRACYMQCDAEHDLLCLVLWLNSCGLKFNWTSTSFFILTVTSSLVWSFKQNWKFHWWGVRLTLKQCMYVGEEVKNLSYKFGWNLLCSLHSRISTTRFNQRVSDARGDNLINISIIII